MTSISMRKTIGKPSELRRSQRELVDYATRLRWSECRGVGGWAPVRIINISAFGLMGRSDEQPPVGTRVFIDLPLIGMIDAEVRWADDGRIGVEFSHPISEYSYRRVIAEMPARQRAGDAPVEGDPRASQRH